MSLVGGCVRREAPSFPVVGAYFPAWMICALFGIATAIGLRTAFVFTNLDAFLSLRLFTYVSLGVIAALALWVGAFGP
jgi:hypothetical protein